MTALGILLLVSIAAVSIVLWRAGEHGPAIFFGSTVFFIGLVAICGGLP